MTAALRYVFVTSTGTRAVLVPVVAYLFALLGVYAYPDSEVGPTFAFTSLACCALTAWLVGALLWAEPAPQAEIATAALGGWERRARLEAAVVCVVAAVLSAGFLVFPTILGRFDRPVQAGDVAAAALGHLSCGLLGGAIAVLYSPPRVTRPPTSAAAVLATLLALVALAGLLGGYGGPVWVAHGLYYGPAGAVDGTEVLASASCVALTAIALLAARRLLRRSA
jgi:hypothetical protein